MSRRSAVRNRSKKAIRTFSRQVLNENKCKILELSLHQYSSQRVSYLRSINQILNKTGPVLSQLLCWAESEMLERVFEDSQGAKEMHDLSQYYKFYLNTPMLAGATESKVMGTYWSRNKALYYTSIKKMLRLEVEESQELSDKNIEQSQGYYMGQSTFRLPSMISVMEDNQTLEELLNIMKEQQPIKTVKRQARIEPATASHSKSHKKLQNKMVPVFSTATSQAKGRKSQDSQKRMYQQNFRSQSRGSLLKMSHPTLKAVHPQPETTLNYYRRDTGRRDPKDKNKRRQTSQTHLPVNEKLKVRDKRKSQSKKNRLKSSEPDEGHQVTVRAAIHKIKHKIQGQKREMLKNYSERGFSNPKSIDSTNEGLRHKK